MKLISTLALVLLMTSCDRFGRMLIGGGVGSISELDGGQLDASSEDDGGDAGEKPPDAGRDGGSECRWHALALPGIPTSINNSRLVSITVYDGLTYLAAIWSKEQGVIAVVGRRSDGTPKSTSAVSITDDACLLGNTSYFSDQPGSPGFEPFGWCLDGGYSRLPLDPGPGAYAVIHDSAGDTIVGEMKSRPTVWRRGDAGFYYEYVALNAGATYGADSRGNIAGELLGDSGYYEPFVAHPSGGPPNRLLHGRANTAARYILADGSIIGSCGSVACVWPSEDSQPVPLESEPGFTFVEVARKSNGFLVGSQGLSNRTGSIWLNGPLKSPVHIDSVAGLDGGQAIVQIVGATSDAGALIGVAEEHGTLSSIGVFIWNDCEK